MRALFQEICRNRIQITISVRRLREEFKNLISVVVTQVKDEKLGGVNGGGNVRRGRNMIDK